MKELLKPKSEFEVSMTETELDVLLKTKHTQIDNQLRDQIRGQLVYKLGYQLRDQLEIWIILLSVNGRKNESLPN